MPVPHHRTRAAARAVTLTALVAGTFACSGLLTAAAANASSTAPGMWTASGLLPPGFEAIGDPIDNLLNPILPHPDAGNPGMDPHDGLEPDRADRADRADPAAPTDRPDGTEEAHEESVSGPYPAPHRDAAHHHGPRQH